MLVRFYVENYRSFRQRVELSMIAAPLDGHPDHLIPGAIPEAISLLKLAVIFGANASGKSNLVKALDTARRMVLHPAEVGKPLHIVPYKLDRESAQKPSRFEFELRLKGRYFAYGFVASAKRIEEEWLYELDGDQESPIFERDRGGFRSPGLHLAGEAEQFLQFTAKGTRSNRLFLSECRQRDLQKYLPEAEMLFDVLAWFEEGLEIVFPDSKFHGLVGEVKGNRVFKDELSAFLRCYDTGIEGVDLEEVAVERANIPVEILQKIGNDLELGESALLDLPQGVRMLVTLDTNGTLHAWRLVATHKGTGGESAAIFGLNDESDGTRRLTDLAPAMIRLLKGDSLFVVDEFDRSLHPDIAHSLIANFLHHASGRTSQLIVTTHETTLLSRDFLRADEIWFVENQPEQGSRLISLAEYKSGKGDDLQQDYLQGRFGGTPILHDFSWLGGVHAQGA